MLIVYLPIINMILSDIQLASLAWESHLVNITNVVSVIARLGGLKICESRYLSRTRSIFSKNLDAFKTTNLFWLSIPNIDKQSISILIGIDYRDLLVLLMHRGGLAFQKTWANLIFFGNKLRTYSTVVFLTVSKSLNLIIDFLK